MKFLQLIFIYVGLECCDTDPLKYSPIFIGTVFFSGCLSLTMIPGIQSFVFGTPMNFWPTIIIHFYVQESG